ncbi:RHS repeat domain-containing protein [Roseivirga thermotolerans]|uniref:RHS repeat-associated core domain-containing protein n=1 Tax=Roseivirga thermotolerans TaxID=1758176 RepID=A0ABQ3ICV6_9BACT|nr:RHS repeat-associated core domain-containing protein [Roseivirga thermotolerans]GHE76042.1 hypothetical protein GCM10011340_36130 [Roseivirga thermotolerans]
MITKPVEQAGFTYIYLSNESNTTHDVYFDDLRITHTKSKILQEDHYYPFGGSITALSSTAPLSKPNRYKYNGFEEQSEFDLGWYDYQARFYDPQLGRFMQVDPAADLMRRHSPYNYAFDNPIRFIDPDGMMPEDVTDPNGGSRSNSLDYKLVSDDNNVHELTLTQSHTIKSKNKTETITTTTTFTTTAGKDGKVSTAVNLTSTLKTTEMVKNKNGDFEAVVTSSELQNESFDSVDEFKESAGSQLGESNIVDDLYNYQGGLEAQLSIKPDFNPFNGNAQLYPDDLGDNVGAIGLIGVGRALEKIGAPPFIEAFGIGQLGGNLYRNTADHSGRSFNIAKDRPDRKGG